MANAFANFIDRTGTAARNSRFAPLKALGSVDFGISELANGGDNTANTDTGALNGRFFNQEAGRLASNAFGNPMGDTRSMASAPMPGSQSNTTTNGNVPYDQTADINGDGIADSQQYGGTGTGGGAGGSSVQALAPSIKRIPGDTRAYNINDPAERQAFYDARIKLAAQQQLKLTGELDQSTKAALEAGNQRFEEGKRGYSRNLEDLGASQDKYVKDQVGRVQDFGNAYQTNSVQRQNSYASRGDGYQSAQGDEGRLALSQYNSGVTDLNDEKNTALNAFGKQRGDIDYSNQNLAKSYQAFKGDLQNTTNQRQSDIAQYTNNIKTSTAAELDPINAAQGINNFDYKLDTYNPLETKTADLGKYGAATSFDALPGQQGTSGANAFGNPMKEGQAAYLEAEDKKKKALPQLSYQL